MMVLISNRCGWLLFWASQNLVHLVNGQHEVVKRVVRENNIARAA